MLLTAPACAPAAATRLRGGCLRERGAAQRPRAGASEDPQPEGLSASDLAGLSARVAALRDSVASEDQRCAANWRRGRAQHSTLTLLPDWARRLALSPCGASVAVGTYSGAVHVIDASSGRLELTLSGLVGEVTALAFDGRRVAAGSSAGGVASWDACSGTGGVLGSQKGAVHAVQLAGDHGVLAGGASGELCTFGGRRVTRLRVSSAVSSLQRAGYYTAAGLADGRVVVWAGSLASEEGEQDEPPRQILSFQAHAAPVLCLQLLGAAADEQRAELLVTAGGDGAVKTWDLAAGEQLLSIDSAHRAAVTCLQADHAKIVTGGKDGCVRVWCASTGTLRFSLAPFTSYLDGLAFKDHALLTTGCNNAVSMHDFRAASTEEA